MLLKLFFPFGNSIKKPDVCKVPKLRVRIWVFSVNERIIWFCIHLTHFQLRDSA